MESMPSSFDYDVLPRFAAPADGQLSAGMRAAYDTAGVVILEHFVAPDACRRLVARIRELVEAFDPRTVKSVFSTIANGQYDDAYFRESGDKIRYFFEDGAFDADGVLRRDKHVSLNKIGHALHDLDPAFARFSRTPKLRAAAARLGLDAAVLIQSMVIFKPPRIGGEVVCHQDSTYLYTEPESCMGFWFALEDASIDNGCMVFIPGAHRAPLRARHFRRADGTLVTETLDPSPWPDGPRLPAEAPAGSLVIFSGRAPHMSGPNRSTKSRLAYSLHAIDARSHYPADNWLQRDPSLPLRGFA
jgi:phytanoyl-CoA hydroxylase